MTHAAAGYVDLQVNGYGGVDFNQDALTGEQLEQACLKLRANGVGCILATLITEEVETVYRRLENIVKLRDQSELAREMIAGFHIEGPFINPADGYRGAHPKDAVRPADVSVMQRMLEAGRGLVRLVTLAPEQDAGMKVTRMLAGSGVIVSAGHCDPSLEQLRAGVDAGLSLFTHLGNGCPMMMHRHDNIIQRVLSMADRLRICFIADGVHVPFPALSNYLKIVGVDRAVVVTDAIAPAGLGPGKYTLGRWELLIEEDMVARAPDRSHFVGSAISMPQTIQNLTGPLGLSIGDAMKLVRDNPARVLGLRK